MSSLPTFTYLRDKGSKVGDVMDADTFGSVVSSGVKLKKVTGTPQYFESGEFLHSDIPAVIFGYCGKEHVVPFITDKMIDAVLAEKDVYNSYEIEFDERIPSVKNGGVTLYAHKHPQYEAEVVSLQRHRAEHVHKLNPKDFKIA